MTVGVFFSLTVLTLTAAVMEVGIYISSNNLSPSYDTDQFIDLMLQTIPWSVLKSILATQSPTIQAFVENVLKFAVASEQIVIVRDLLVDPSLKLVLLMHQGILLSAVRTSNVEIVRVLLAAGSNPNGNYPCQPLLKARTVEMAQVLVNAGANVGAEGPLILGNYGYRWTGPLILKAIQQGNADLVHYLIRVGAKTDVYGVSGPKDPVKITALMLAMDSGNIEIIHTILDRGLDVNEINFVRKLRCKYCTRKRCYCYCTGTTVLQEAAALGNLDIVKVLIQYGGNVNAPAYGENGARALHAAVSHGNTEVVEFLLENGADVNHLSNEESVYSRSALTIAMETNHTKIVAMLVKAGADMSVHNFAQANEAYHQTELRKAVLACDLNTIRRLVEHGVQIRLRCESDGQLKSNRKTILQYALHDKKNPENEMFHFLFDKLQETNEGVNFLPILLEAVEFGNLGVIERLLEAGGDINTIYDTTSEGTGTLLMLAVVYGDRNTILFLLGLGADVNIAVPRFNHYDFRCCTALQLSMSKDRRDSSSAIFFLLMEHGAEINAPVSRRGGRSELAFAVEARDMAVVMHLLELGVNVNLPPAEEYGVTALQAAAELDPADIPMVQLLLKFGADVNAPAAKRSGTTALGAAAWRGHFQVAVILLEAGADVNAVDDTGKTPLELAAGCGRLDMVHLLLKAGADMHLPEDERYIGAARIARLSGRLAIATQLEKWKEDKDLLRSTELVPNCGLQSVGESVNISIGTRIISTC